MAHEQVFEGMTTSAVQDTFDEAARIVSDGALTAAVSVPPPPPGTAPVVSYTALEGAVLATWQGLVDSQLFPFLTDTFTTSAQAVVDGLAAAGATADVLTNVYAADYLSYAQNRMVDVGEQLWQVIQEQLEESFAAGESTTQAAQRLVSSAGLSVPRALVTARTEMISAANAGSYVQMLEAGFDDQVTKVWLATEDTRTRESHRHADNQDVQLTAEFQVDIYAGGVKTGTEGLEFPGDPTGTPGNIINCRCSLAFDFSEDEEEGGVLVAADFIEKQHPRDKDGKFKKKGAPDTFVPKVGWKPGDPTPTKDSSSLAKVQYIVHEKLEGLSGQQKASFLKAVEQDDWNALEPTERAKIAASVSTITHPEAKDAAKSKLKSLLANQKTKAPVSVLPAGEPDADSAAPATARPQGGTITKTGKELKPGSPTALKVQLLYQSTFADGAVMAVRKESDERIVWDDKAQRILRQKKGADGKYATTETLTRGDTYKKYKDETGWTIPDGAEAAPAGAPAGAAVPAGPELGKPVALKVQLIYQTPFEDGDIVAVHPGKGEVITWDAKKKRMVVTSTFGDSQEFTRGALYKAYKDEDGWFLPADKKTAPVFNAPAGLPAAIPAAPVVDPDVANFSTKKVSTAQSRADMKKFLDSPDGAVGTVIFKPNDNVTITKTGVGTAEIDYQGIAQVPMASSDLDSLTAFGAKIKQASDVAKVKKAAQSAPAYTPPQFLDDDSGKKLADALGDPNVPNGTLLFSGTTGATVITKKAAGVAEVSFTGTSGVPQTKELTAQDITAGAHGDPLANIMASVLELQAQGGILVTPSSNKVSAVSSPSTIVSDTDVEGIKDNFDIALDDDLLFENPDLTVEKYTDTAVIVKSKHNPGYDATYSPHDLTAEHLNDFADLAGAPAAPAAPTVPGNAVPADKADSIKKWAKDPLTNAGEELHNGTNFKIVKGAPGAIVVYPKDASGNADTSKGQILFGNEITAQGIEDLLGQMGLSAGTPVVISTPVPVNAPSPQFPLKMTHTLLVNPKTTGAYKHGQVIAEKPTENEQLVWNADKKKFVVQVKGSGGKWYDSFVYSKQAAYKSLKDDQGWVTPSTTQSSFAGGTPGQAPVPSISGSPVQPHQLAPKTSANAKPKSLFGPSPKFTVAELQDQADKQNATLTPAQRSELFSLYKSKGGNGTIYLSSPEKEQFEGLLETYVAFNDKNPNNKISLLQVLRVVDEVSAKNANAANTNLYEKKITAWLATPAGTSAAKNIASQLQLAANSDKKTLAYNKTLAKFQETASNRAKGSQAYKKIAQTSLNNQAGIQPHTPGQQYPQVMSVAEGNAIAAKMGTIPAANKQAMQDYTGSSYTSMNNYMRSFGKSSTSQQTRSELVEAGMKPIPQAITVHRNVSTVFDTEWTPTLDQLKDFVGVTFREDAFASTSIAGHAFNGMKYRFIIEIPEGTPLRWVQQFSNVKSEDEFLLASGLNYEILSVHGPNELSGPFASTANKTAVIKMRVVPPPADAKAQLGVK